MGVLSRDERDVQAIVNTWAQATGATPDVVARTSEKLALLLDWLKGLRRVVHNARRYDKAHPTQAQAIDLATDSLRYILKRYGALSLLLSLQGVVSEEGIGLPNILDADGEGHGHVFHCLSRDGVARIIFKPGVERGEIEHLIDVIAHDGRREGDNTVTWIWAGRLDHIRLELDPSIAPHAAALAVSHGSTDPVIQTYLGTLQQADPNVSPRDIRPRICSAHAEALAALGVTRELVAFYQLAGQFDPSQLLPTDEIRATAQAELADRVALESRAAAVRQKIAAGGIP